MTETTSPPEPEKALVPHVTKDIKAQFEFLQTPDGKITVNVYDPLLFAEWNGATMLDLMDKGDKNSSVMKLMIAMLSAASYWPEVSSVVDIRSGTVLDVSKRNWKTGMDREWEDSHIRARYDDRVSKGIIDEDEFPFEEFAKDFRKNNK